MRADSPERWRPVVGYEDTHEVSDAGRVRSLDRIVSYRDGRQRRYTGQVLAGRSGDAYGHKKVALSRGIDRFVAHLVLEAFVGPRPPGQESLHGPAGGGDDSLTNLSYGSRSDNCRDRTRDGTDYNRAKTQCPTGHGLGEPNVTAWARDRGHRACLACSRARAYLQDHPEVDFRATADAYYAELGGHATCALAAAVIAW